MNDTIEKKSLEIRRTFVGMLFALVVGQIAISISEVVKIYSWPEAAPAAAHLLLALSVVATSWVGWSLSVAPGNQLPISGVFQIPFLVLVLDVTLVIAYFILAKGAELGELQNQLEFLPPSARVETITLFAVFLLYAAWDLLTRVFSHPRLEWKDRLGELVCTRWASASFWCTALAFVTVILLGCTTSLVSVVLTDLALIALVFLFRAAKWAASSKRINIWVILFAVLWAVGVGAAMCHPFQAPA